MALIGFVDPDRQWFQAEIGYGRRETGLDQSVCVHALPADRLFVIPALAADVRTRDNPAVSVDDGFRFHAAVVVRSRADIPLGTVCILDRDPRPEGVTPAQGETLAALARQVSALVEHRRALAEVPSAKPTWRRASGVFG